MEAIKTAVATSAGLDTSRVEWAHTGRDGEWTEYPRVKLTPAGNRQFGLPEERHTWVEPTATEPGYLRREVWSVDLFRVTARIECDATALGDGAPFGPADRFAKVIYTPGVSEALRAAGVALNTLGEFGPFAATAENRELSVSVAEMVFQVNAPVDTTPPGGVGWFNRVEINYEVKMPGFTVGPVTENPSTLLYLPSTPLTGTSGNPDKTADLVLPRGFVAGVGTRYQLSGVFLVYSAAGALLACREVGGIIAQRGSGTWVELVGGWMRTTTFTGWSSYFVSETNLPGLGFTGTYLQAFAAPRNGASVRVEFRGAIAAYVTSV